MKENAVPVPPHDCLKDFLLQTPFGRQVLNAMDTDGYLVLPNVLTAKECEVEMDRLWDFVTATSPSVRRDDPATWYPQYEEDGVTLSSQDPWPHSGWAFLSEMCQSYQAGWLFSDLREKLAIRIFEPMYGTRELHSSKEGKQTTLKKSSTYIINIARVTNMSLI